MLDRKFSHKLGMSFKAALCAMVMIPMSACSVFGNPGVEIAPYNVFQKDGDIEIRSYEELVLVSTPMNTLDDNGSAFGRLFNYISGENLGEAKIDMTAPVLMDSTQSNSEKIAMTAPVIVGQDAETAGPTMSFVLPSKFTYESAPRPTNPDVTLNKLSNFRVAAIRFSGTLNMASTQKHRKQLEEWIESNGYRVVGPYKSAGYNPPWTVPNMRRNEVLIPIEPVEEANS